MTTVGHLTASHASADSQRLLSLIIRYRWISLLPPLILLISQTATGSADWQPWFVLGAATAANGVIALFTTALNERVQQRPAWLLLDFGLSAALITLSGGWQSPYYLYALNPIIIAGLFFYLRGALLAASAFLPLYVGALLLAAQAGGAPLNWAVTLTGAAGFYVLGSPFGYLSALVARLRQAQTDLLDAQNRIAQQTAIDAELAHQRAERVRLEAQQEAVQQERLRIARDMHDTVSQDLFGLAFGLDGCHKLLPAHPDEAKAELAALRQVAQNIRTDVRQIILDIWPDELTAERFSADLQRYVSELTPTPPLTLDMDIRGDFAPLSPHVRRSLYRICQESLANIAQHAQADQARVCLDIVGGRARLLIRDNGCGFEPALVGLREESAEHFGLRGMQERARALGGTFDAFSRPAAGTSIVVDIPVQLENGARGWSES